MAAGKRDGGVAMIDSGGIMSSLLARITSSVMLVLGPVALHSATAQPLGTYSWQLQPYCNRVTFTVTHTSGVFTLDGFDDRCGSAVRAPAAGVASINPNGSVNVGFSIITPDVGPLHVNVAINVATLSGTWRDNYLYEGTFAFNASAPGVPRPSPLLGYHYAGGYFGTINFGGGFFFGRAHRGTSAAPGAVEFGDSLARFGGGGFNGEAYTNPTGMIEMVAAEDWTPTANGTRLAFWTTEIGTTGPDFPRMVIDYNGFVGIGTLNQRPNDRLDVNGDVRVRTGCVKDGNGEQIAGICPSDDRFKQDVVSYEDVLPRVAALRPVTFSWRADAFPERGFGPARASGLIAQEVEQVLPELVTTDEDGFKAVDYRELPLLAIQAIKELKERNDVLEQRLKALEALVAHATTEKR
jgi:Chaperone of endosialidase